MKAGYPPFFSYNQYERHCSFVYQSDILIIKTFKSEGFATLNMCVGLGTTIVKVKKELR